MAAPAGDYHRRLHWRAEVTWVWSGGEIYVPYGSVSFEDEENFSFPIVCSKSLVLVQAIDPAKGQLTIEGNVYTGFAALYFVDAPVIGDCGVSTLSSSFAWFDTRHVPGLGIDDQPFVITGDTIELNESYQSTHSADISDPYDPPHSASVQLKWLFTKQ